MVNFFNCRAMALMMALAGIVGCETVPNKERLDANEKEAMALCKQIKAGKLHGSYSFGENNHGRYGEIAISVYGTNNTIRSYTFTRNAQGLFDKKESVRPVIRVLDTPKVIKIRREERTEWVPYPTDLTH